MKFTNRSFGLEIEFTHTNPHRQELTHDEKMDLVLQLRQAGIPIMTGYRNESHSGYWKLTRDGSCGNELVSPILSGKEGLEEVKKVTEILINFPQIKVNKNCGLHVHIDARDLSKKQITKVFLNYAKWEKVFDALVPPSRRRDSNGFCKSIEWILNYSTLNEEFKKDYARSYSQHFDKYYKVNLIPYVTQGSIEFRQHSGTLNADKIINWVILLIGFVEKTSKGHYADDRPNNYTFKRFKKWMKLRSSDRYQPEVQQCNDFISKRFKELNHDVKFSTELV